MGHYAGGLEILRSPSVPGTIAPDIQKVHQVLTVTQSLYRWVVADLGRPSKFSFDLLEKLNEVFLVTSTSIPSVYETKRTIDGLRAAGFQTDRVRIIVNQISTQQEIPESELQGLLGLPVYARFAPAGQELHDACAHKRMPGKSSAFGLRMAELARKMAKLQTEHPRSRVARMFSFSEKRSTASKRSEFNDNAEAGRA